MSPEPLSLRPIADDDIGHVAAIHVAAFASCQADGLPCPSGTSVPVAPRSQRFREPGDDALAKASASLREELARPWAHVWVACRGERVVGAFVAWVVADEVHVLDVATHPDDRRQGVGRALVTELVALARRLHALHMYLEVRRSNAAAIALYRGAGFATVGIRARYYADDEDAVEMALGFDGETGEVVPRADEV